MEEELCNTGLALGIGSPPSSSSVEEKRKRPIKFHLLFPPRNCGEEEEESSKNCSNQENHDANVPRKKLKLSKDQSSLLEESFRARSTLTQMQKQELAERLNLRPRQVEVWFQNRRARTKLKQTEVDCEFLKKCCESLTDENRRLKKELQELRSVKMLSPFYIQFKRASSGERLPPVSSNASIDVTDRSFCAIKDSSSMAY